MTSVRRVVVAVGEGTQARIRSSSINNNVDDPSEANRWRGITSVDNANVIIQDLEMIGNENLEHHLTATFGGTMSIVDLEVQNSTGSLNTVSPFSHLLFFNEGVIVKLKLIAYLSNRYLARLHLFFLQVRIAPLLFLMLFLEKFQV